METNLPTHGWYAACRVYFAQPAAERCPVTRQALAHYRWIARLPRAMGEDLDRRGAPQFVMRWIAWAKPAEARQLRYEAAIEHHARMGRWPKWDRLREMAESGRGGGGEDGEAE